MQCGREISDGVHQDGRRTGLFSEREPRTFVEPGLFGPVVVRESKLDLLPGWLKALIAVGVLIVCVRFTIPFLDWVFRIWRTSV